MLPVAVELPRPAGAVGVVDAVVVVGAVALADAAVVVRVVVVVGVAAAFPGGRAGSDAACARCSCTLLSRAPPPLPADAPDGARRALRSLAASDSAGEPCAPLPVAPSAPPIAALPVEGAAVGVGCVATVPAPVAP